MSDEPDKTTLSAVQRNQITAWFATNWKGTKACPICLQTNWTISEHLVSPIVMHGGGFNLGGVSYPQVMLISPCGYTIYFNAVVMKVFVEGDDKQEVAK